MLKMDEVLNELKAINQRLEAQHKEIQATHKRLHNVEEWCHREEENKTVTNKRFLTLDRKIDVICSQSGKKKVVGHSNATFDEEPGPSTSRDTPRSDIALKEIDEGGILVPNGRFQRVHVTKIFVYIYTINSSSISL